MATNDQTGYGASGSTKKRRQKPEAFSYAPYEKSQTVLQAEQQLSDAMAQKPKDYVSQWQSKQDAVRNQLENRERFVYDASSDALYQQLKDQYIRQGQLAMEDTLGKAAALTGGYDNSYAQTAAQQTYQEHLRQLSQYLPELSRQAYERYEAQGRQLQDRYDLYQALEQQDYSRYQDQLDGYYTQLGQLMQAAQAAEEQDYSRYRDGYDAAYGRYQDQLALWQAEEERAAQAEKDRLEQQYNARRDAVKDAQWQAEFDEDKRRYELENEPGTVTVTAPVQQEQPLSAAGENFLKTLPYAHAGSQNAWKKLVAERLKNAVAGGSLTQTDAKLIRKQLELE